MIALTNWIKSKFSSNQIISAACKQRTTTEASMKTPLWLLLATLALQAPAQNIVVNGSFESYGPPLNGWNTTESYNVGNSSPADGQLFVMLSGNLYQDLPTVPGQVYQLRYAVAG